MALKLHDMECLACKEIVVDCLLTSEQIAAGSVSVADLLGEADIRDVSPTCCGKGPYRPVLSVPRHSKHTSWEVK